MYTGLAQEKNNKPDSSATRIDLEEVTLSVNKWEQKLNEVPNKISKITKTEILRNNPQTSADLLTQTGTVFVQKSQLGGGSPMIRGFSTNRLLYVVDGERMNTAIFRSGNLRSIVPDICPPKLILTAASAKQPGRAAQAAPAGTRERPFKNSSLP